MPPKVVVGCPARVTLSPIILRLKHRGLSDIATKAQDAVQLGETALSRITTKTLLRSLVLTSIMRRAWIMQPSLKFLNLVTKSKSPLLDLDRNPLLNRLIRWALYNHFCAGTTHAEISHSIAKLKAMGYQGVILGHAREFTVDLDSGVTKSQNAKYIPAGSRMVEEWKQLNLDTLRMLQPGDFLSLKMTGAGPIAIDAMRARQPMPEVVLRSMEDICIETKQRGARLWVDAEQQVFQVGLDDWVIELMRKFNRDGQPLVYNTIQAYLKGARDNASRHITLAATEGWTVGVKLVRGAYIEHEIRSLIHDTKEETDRSYDEIVETLISRTPWPIQSSAKFEFPSAALFLATHNRASAEKAIRIHRSRATKGLPMTKLESGQIMGMADELSCALLENRDQYAADVTMSDGGAPGIFKFMACGSVGECLGYLHRRAIENRGAVERTKYMVDALKRELRRRVLG
ncbi:carbapenem antibiotics biosynthesis protein carD [Colletotrichum abscissum]|nr:carbapenem antibiotics biosynthesis protein carD [Colletotrichum abscissum]KAK1498654.1 carbapenem antibiotics biosynthesis protein carD [Colletotrichum abscissum]